MPGCRFSNSSPNSVKLSVSEAAAKTFTVPDSPSEPPPDEAAPESDDEQALRATSAAAPAPVT
ncbi:hypothetical protein GCM10010095_16020 [Streptomyces anthocyanicus]|uniref:Uncharacterized protein n=1 Tax=Streptomyces violaceolatus TaxID=67378 RepID=A0ABN3SA57_9ACTN|nr:hypothetical protein SLITK23_35950 [Streptomyces lividans]GGL31594.1 hypothetical protein GCM10010095_16020 [Streptomyces anthocyanicus]GHC01155.1 hypothetical protein GCM10010348_22190 [Streptomyces anthocyanicus]